MSFVVDFVGGFLSLLLAPIDLVIKTFLPSTSGAFEAITSFMEIVFSCMAWVISLTGIDTFTLNLIIDYTIFRFFAPLMIFPFKIVLSWYNYLK